MTHEGSRAAGRAGPSREEHSGEGEAREANSPAGVPWLSVALAAPGLASAVLTPLAPFAVFSSLVGFLTLSGSGRRRAVARALAVASALATAAGMFRFATGPGLQGIVEAGTRAAGQRAVSRLREIVFAEDGMRKLAVVDPDGDGVGSAGFLGELCGAVAPRSGNQLEVPVLSREYCPAVATPNGPAAAIEGYLYQVCLPQMDRGFSAKLAAPVDEERAERRFLAYAWPSSAEEHLRAVYFVDEHERVLVSTNHDGAGGLSYAGASRPPPCRAASDDRRFRPWRGKKPRASLPGDSSSVD